MEKICTLCGPKPLTCFGRKRDTADGLNIHCKECHAKKSREWYARSRDRMLGVKKSYYQANRSKMAQAQKRWVEENRDRKRAINSRADAKRRGKEVAGQVSKEEFNRILETYGSKCLYCNSDANLTFDHVIPLAKGGTHHPSNLVPACKSCNSSKQDRDLAVFLADRGLPRPVFKGL